MSSSWISAFFSGTVFKDRFLFESQDRTTGQSAGYGFVKLTDHENADIVMNKVNGMMLYGQEVRLNWAFTSNHREEGPAGNNLHVFVGDLSNEVSDQVLLKAFSDHWDTT